ncbi:DUF2975 domain-containing protein [Parerythrobacter aestuarii]|uniref:DUF2975 domain-containing protein n=1 Tax=Parerythrobacter aestuarii TaxID=3020909 RepID=UPI0024DEC760|nr:DUF2975 domain-containing protein [Parerythrobacter aestuarii]
MALLTQGALAVAGAALAIVLPFLIVMQDRIDLEIRAEHAGAVDPLPVAPIVAVILLALAAVALLFLFFGKLRQIIATVGEGDPFIPDNADRLNAMAWMMVGVYLLGIAMAVVGASVSDWANQLESAHLTFAVDFDASSILTIVILFILARVFRHGAAMREDLEGTV